MSILIGIIHSGKVSLCADTRASRDGQTAHDLSEKVFVQKIQGGKYVIGSGGSRSLQGRVKSAAYVVSKQIERGDEGIEALSGPKDLAQRIAHEIVNDRGDLRKGIFLVGGLDKHDETPHICHASHLEKFAVKCESRPLHPVIVPPSASAEVPDWTSQLRHELNRLSSDNDIESVLKRGVVWAARHDPGESCSEQADFCSIP